MKEKMYKENLRQETTYLQDLISRMDKGDKTYFKRYLQRGATDQPNKYAILFDTIDDLDGDADDKTIIEKLKKKSLNFEPKVFKTEKARLYALILSAMRANIKGYENPSGATLKARLLDINFLVEKGLINQALIELSKLKLIAETGERVTELLEILEVEIKLLLLLPVKDFPENYYEEVKNEYMGYIEQSQTNFYFLNHYLAVQALFDENYFFRKDSKNENIERLEKILNEIINEKLNNNLTLNSKILRTLCLYILEERSFCIDKKFDDTMIRQKYAELFIKYKDCLIDFESYPNFSELLPVIEFAYFSFLDSMLRVGRKKSKAEVTFVVNKIKDFPFANKSLKAGKDVLINIGEIANLYISGQFPFHDRSYVHKIEVLLKEGDLLLKTDQKIRILFAVARLVFSTGHYEVAREWFLKIVDLKADPSIRTDLQSAAYILVCLCDYELKNYTSLKSSIVPAQKFVEETKMNLEKGVVSFFTSVLRSYNFQDSEEEFVEDVQSLEKDFIEQLEILHKDKDNRNFFSTFEYVFWFKSENPFDFEKMLRKQHDDTGAP